MIKCFTFEKRSFLAQMKAIALLMFVNKGCFVKIGDFAVLQRCFTGTDFVKEFDLNFIKGRDFYRMFSLKI